MYRTRKGQGKGKGKGDTFETNLSHHPLQLSPFESSSDNTPSGRYGVIELADYWSVGARGQEGCRQSGLDDEDDSNVRGSHKRAKRHGPRSRWQRFASSNLLPRL